MALLVGCCSIPGSALGREEQSEDKGASSGSQARWPYSGLILAEALRDLQARGLALVFSSELVSPEMRVSIDPVAETSRQALDQLLAPHALRAQAGPERSWIVVAAPPPPESGWTLAGMVRSRHDAAPVAGASITLRRTDLRTESHPNGRYELGSLEPGLYSIEIRAPGFLPGRLGNVVVTADRLDVDLELQPAPFVHDAIVVRSSEISVLQETPALPLALSREQIESQPHLGGDVFRSLSLMPGTSANDLTAQFSIHGGRRDEVKIILDGQELYEAFHLKEYDNALSVVAAEELASVGLSTGGFAADHGDRMSGVLDLRTKTAGGPVRTRLGASLLSAMASSAGGLFDQRLTWLATVRRGSIDLANRILGKEDPSFWDLYAKGDLRLGTGSSLRAHSLSTGDELTFTEMVDDEVKRWNTQYDTSYEWLTHQSVLGRRLLVDSTGSWSRIDRDRRGAEDEEDQSFVVLDRRRFDVGSLSQNWSLLFDTRHTLSWGAEARRYEADYDYLNLADPPLLPSTPLSQPRQPATRFTGLFRGEHFGVFVSDRFSPTGPLTVELGLRYDRHTLTDDTLWSPRANLAWRTGASSVLRLGWGYFHQTQRPYELEVQDGEDRFAPAERSEHWVVGWELLLDDRDDAALRALRLELFRRDIGDPRARYENLFEPFNAFPEIEPDRVRIEPERSRSQGIEMVLRGAAGARLRWWLNYSFSSAEDRIAGISVNRWNDQPHALNLDLAYRVGAHWNLSFALRVHSGWPTTPITATEIVDEEGKPELILSLGKLYSERLDSYHRLDLRASREWRRGSGLLTVFFDIQNVYNRKNLAGFDLTLDDEDGVFLKEQERSPGIFPSVGVSWQF